MPINGRVRVVGSVLVVLANAMALRPPIQWIIFFVVGVIGLGPLINLLDGLPLNGASYFGICCLDFSSLGILLEQCFLAEGSLLSSLPFFFGFWLHLFDCCFGSFCVRVLRASTRMSLSTLIWLCHIRVWGGVSIYP